MSRTAAASPEIRPVKAPKGLSERIFRLRTHYFKGAARKWNNETTAWTTGTPWDVQFNEMDYYIVPETYLLLQPVRSSYRQAARKVDLPGDFWSWPLARRRAWFVKEVMVSCLPKEILPGDLIAGGRFNLATSMCMTRSEQRDYDRRTMGKKGARAAVKWFHDHGFGNAGATSGHLIPDYPRVLSIGWEGIHADLEKRLRQLSRLPRDRKKADQLRAMMTAATMARDVAAGYSGLCRKQAAEQADFDRKKELLQMAENLEQMPWKPAKTFWQAVQSLWMTHMLVMSDENYPGPGLSFGRIDQYLLPFWEISLCSGMDREFGKEILKSFFMHANTAYDAMIRNGNQGITSGFGQLITLSGCGANGADLTNDLTHAFLEVIDEMSPLLEPKPNVRVHRNSPDHLLDKLVEMISVSQGAPFLLNFDERSMAGMMRQSRIAGLKDRINEQNVHDYAPVGCLENTMAGNDRSGTVDCNLNLLKAVELALTGGKDLVPFADPLTGRKEKIRRHAPDTGNAAAFETWDQFWEAYVRQTAYIVEKCVNLYEVSESVRAEYLPTPYLSCLVRGCAETATDITQGGARISFVTMEGVTFATTVDSLLAIRYLVFEQKKCTMAELIVALENNWEGREALQAAARNRAPKYGRDNDAADRMAAKVMELWTQQVWKYKTRSTGRQFRPGMLSWNYWAGDGFVMAASADGRKQGQFLSNAICPSAGADAHGPTANANSVGKALGGKDPEGQGDWKAFVNLLPNGASHTITFSPAIIRDSGHKDKFKAFLRGYGENGGTCLQVNMLDPDMLRDAQAHPQHYRHLLVRITGYNAYFTAIGKELQNEVIARISHSRF